jgi:ATP-dependent RNA helicase RhlE
MALHGNKSQSARTQALEGFKTGQIRALVATDIAARGIDIDDLPHVVNYEIPNVPEDYVHRIGRTGRAGREGQAVSLVCMDEEGFMMEIERFTKQEIPVQVIEGFGPDEGEKAEPIAMGRQTIWGGAGKPPGRDVMQAAAKAARQEMMERIRTNKATQGSPRGGRQGSGNGGNGEGQRAGGPQGSGNRPAGQRAQQQQQPNAGGGRRRGGSGGNSNAGGNGGGNRRFDDSQPRSENAHLGTQLGHIGIGPRHGAGGRGSQPDPMRTSVDSMADRGRRGGGGGFRSGGGGGSRGPRGGGGGFGR